MRFEGLYWLLPSKWSAKSSDARKRPYLHKDAAPDRPVRKTGKASLALLAAARVPDVYE